MGFLKDAVWVVMGVLSVEVAVIFVTDDSFRTLIRFFIQLNQISPSHCTDLAGLVKISHLADPRLLQKVLAELARL